MSTVTDTSNSVGLGYAPGQNKWNSFIGNIWQDIFLQSGLKRQGTLIEIAPGSVNKIGSGLSNYGFNGVLYLVEPNLKSLNSIAEQYRQMLSAKIIPINATLKEAIPSLPKKVNSIISNHPLDDMIIGKYLDEPEFDDLFDDHYDNASAKKTRGLWQRLENSGRIESIKKSVADEFSKLIAHTNPDQVVISQYESYFFKSNNLTAPDKHAFDVLQMIRSRYSRSSSNLCLERYVEDKDRWLILGNH